MTKREKIASRASEVLRETPSSIRYGELVKVLGRDLPDMKVATIRSSIWDLDKRNSDSVYKPEGALLHDC